MILSHALPVVSPRQPCALGQLLWAQVSANKWGFTGPDGAEVPGLLAVSRMGFLPALMAAAVWECRVPMEELSRQLFVGFEEPTTHRFSCGFYLASKPAPHRWAFPLLAHLRTHLKDGVVDLEPAWSAWTEGVRGTSMNLTFCLPLDLRPDDRG